MQLCIIYIKIRVFVSTRGLDIKMVSESVLYKSIFHAMQNALPKTLKMLNI